MSSSLTASTTGLLHVGIWQRNLRGALHYNPPNVSDDSRIDDETNSFLASNNKAEFTPAGVDKSTFFGFVTSTGLASPSFKTCLAKWATLNTLIGNQLFSAVNSADPELIKNTFLGTLPPWANSLISFAIPAVFALPNALRERSKDPADFPTQLHLNIDKSEFGSWLISLTATQALNFTSSALQTFFTDDKTRPNAAKYFIGAASDLFIPVAVIGYYVANYFLAKHYNLASPNLVTNLDEKKILEEFTVQLRGDSPHKIGLTV